MHPICILSLALALSHSRTLSHSVHQGEVVCLRNALVNKVAETEEALRGATAELEDTNR